MSEVIALDIGGTKLAAGLVRTSDRAADGPPAVEAVEIEPTDAMAGGADVARRAGLLVRRVLDAARGRGAEPVRVGVATAGVVDPATGGIAAATDLMPGWAGIPLGARIGEASGLETRVLNDAHAHAIGSALQSAHGRVLCVVFGTGLGGAWVQDGRPVVGHHGAAGHLGHLPVPEADGCRCSCGRMGHVEAVASGSGLQALHARRTGRNWTAQRIADAARAGNGPATDALATAGHAAGRMIGSALNLLDPAEVLLAGGLSAAGAVWEDALGAGIAETAMDVVARTPVRRIEPGPEAALRGAALWAVETA